MSGLVNIVKGALRVYRYKSEIAMASIAAASVAAGYDAVSNPPAVVREVKGEVSGYWKSISNALRPAIVHADSGYNLDLIQYEEALKSLLNNQLVRIWHFNNETKEWSFYDPRDVFQPHNTLKTIESSSPYWIKVNGDVPSLQLYDGWNTTLGSALIDRLVPLPDLQITNLIYNFLKVNVNDGTTSYNLLVTGTYGQTKPDKPFDIRLLLEGIIDTTHQVTHINNDGTFTLEIHEVRLPYKDSPKYNIFAIADISNVINEGGKGKDNNRSNKFMLEVEDPLTVTESKFAYFGETFGVEYIEPGTTYENREIIKWKNPPQVYIQGQPTDSDLAAIEKMIGHAKDAGLDAKFLDKPEGKTTDIYLVPHSQFRNYLPDSVSDDIIAANNGLAWFLWDHNDSIYKSIVIVDSTLPEKERTHFLMEEFYQMLGLGRDSLTHPESITYAPRSFTTELSPYDITNLRILYHPLVKAGMTLNEVRNVIGVTN